MKIALVSEHASPIAALGGVDAGGQNVHVAALASALAGLGNEVTVYTRRDDPTLEREVVMAPGVTVDHIDAGPPCAISKDDLLPYMPEFARQLRWRWVRERPDVAHAHFWMSGWASLMAVAGRTIPVVETFHALGVVKRRHQGDRDTSPAERLEIEQHIARHADRIVATCSDEVFELVRMGASMQQIAVVPCGVDTALFNPDGPVEPTRPGLRRILVVSRLVERKGIATVVEALSHLPDAELVVAGGPRRDELDADPEACRLRKLARSLGVADRLELRGRVERTDLPALFRSADVVACVPWYEPFGIVPLEAMACGVPVIASAVGGLIDSVVHGVTGYHVPPCDALALAAASRRILDAPDHGRALGAAGLRRVRSRFTWRRLATTTLEVYEQLGQLEQTAARAGR